VRRIARDVTAVEFDASGVRLLETGDHAQRGRLPASGGAEQRVELPSRDVEVDARHRGHPVEGLDQLDQPAPLAVDRTHVECAWAFPKTLSPNQISIPPTPWTSGI
jgi:hypothetical protein